MRVFLSIGFKVALTLLILGLFLAQVDLRSIAQVLSTISSWWLIAAVVVVLIQVSIAALRLLMVVTLYGVAIPMPESIRITLEGMFFSQTFVSFLGGDALRIWRIRRLGLSLADSTSAIALDRLIGILVNHTFLLGSLPWLLFWTTNRSVRWTLIFLAFAGVAGFVMVLILGTLRGRGGYLHRLRARIPFHSVATAFAEASMVGWHFLKNFRPLMRVSLASLMIAAANMVAFALILLGMGIDLQLAIGCALLVPAVMEIAMLPISIAGWGLREGAAVVAFGSLGLPTNQALGSSLAFGLILAAVSLIGGVIWLSRRQRLAVASTSMSSHLERIHYSREHSQSKLGPDEI